MNQVADYRRIHAGLFFSQEDIHRAVKTLLQGDEGFRSLYAGDFLNFIMQNVPEMVSITAKYFSKNAVQTGRVVTRYDFGDFFQVFRNVIIQGTFVEINAEEGANIIPQFAVIDCQIRPFDDAHFPQFFHADVNGSTRYVQFFSYVSIRLF